MLPARERGPDEVVVGEPVVEDRNKGLPLRVFLVHRRLMLLLLLLLLIMLLLLCFSPFLQRLGVFVFRLGFSAPCLLLLHHALLRRRSLHLRSFVLFFTVLPLTLSLLSLSTLFSSSTLTSQNKLVLFFNCKCK